MEGERKSRQLSKTEVDLRIANIQEEMTSLRMVIRDKEFKLKELQNELLTLMGV